VSDEVMADDTKERPEGWESLAEEEGASGSLAPNPELEEALREAAEAVDARASERERAREGAEGPPEPAAAGDGEGLPVGELVARALASGDPGDLRAALQRSHDRFVRLSADFENFRRRALKERQEAYRYGSENLVKDLLTVVDNLGRAIEHSRKSGGEELESLLQGVELVQRELVGILGNHHVAEIEALGKPFDPAVHEAMAQVPDETVPPNTVIDVLQKGFRLRDRLLRPARVVLARAAEGGNGGEREAAD
jgi:molecular chaperone GrpE